MSSNGGNGDQLPTTNGAAATQLKIEVMEVEGGGLYIFIQCEKRPGLVVDIVSTLEHTGLNFLQTNISAQDSIIVDVFGTQGQNMPRVHADTLKEVLNDIILSHIR